MAKNFTVKLSTASISSDTYYPSTLLPHIQPSNEIRHANAIVDSISTEQLPFLSERDDFTNELIRKHTISIFPSLPRLRYLSVYLSI